MSITAQPLVATSAGLDHEERTNRRLRLAGVAVLAAAALGSVLASPALTDTPSTDGSAPDRGQPTAPSRVARASAAAPAR